MDDAAAINAIAAMKYATEKARTCDAAIASAQADIVTFTEQRDQFLKNAEQARYDLSVALGPDVYAVMAPQVAPNVLAEVQAAAVAEAKPAVVEEVVQP